jgi:hypothetical protein
VLRWLAVLALAACAGPRLHPEHMLPHVTAADDLHWPDALLVLRATGGGPPEDGRTIDAITFTAALVDTLRLAGLTVATDPDADVALVLQAEILWQDHQEVFIDPRVTVSVRYGLARRGTSAPSWTRVVVASTPTMLEGVFAEGERLHRGNEGAVRANLSKLLAALADVSWVDGAPVSTGS